MKYRLPFSIALMLVAYGWIELNVAPLAALASESSASPFDPSAKVEKLADGFKFTEGPAADKAGNVYFTDQPSDRILRWSTDGKLTTFLEKSGRANGLCFDAEGRLWACADELNELRRIDIATKEQTVIVKDYRGKLLDGPNDVWVRADGGAYFTDPYYKRGYWKRLPEPQQDKRGVYFVSAKGELKRVDDLCTQPNGVVGTADGKTLYVADIRIGKTYAYDIQADGTLANRRQFCGAGSDGMTIDTKGNVYLTGEQVTVYDPTGKKIASLKIPERPANLCFGGADGKTLFITARTGLYSVRTLVGGSIAAAGAGRAESLSSQNPARKLPGEKYFVAEPALPSASEGKDKVVKNESIYDVAITLTKPRKNPPRLGGPLDKVELRMWVPQNVKVIRGAIFNPFNTAQVEQEHWRQAARQWDFAVIGGNYFGVNNVDFPTTLLAALKEFAALSGHAEIEHLPLCVLGMSAGGGMSMSFAELLPSRTIAVAPVCLEVGPKSAVTAAIPTVTIFGEKDGKQMQILLEKLPMQRAAGARWGIAVQWGRRHEFGQANNLIVPFFDAVIRQRYPADASPAKGPVALLYFPESAGYLASPADWGANSPAAKPFASYTEEKGAACWLPSANVAAVWSAFVTKPTGVKFTTPAGFGDKQPFVLHAPDRPLAVKLDLDKKLTVKSVSLFNGDRLLQTITSPPFEFEIKLPSGIHSLIAVATDDKGATQTSRPHTLLVEQN